MFLDTFVCLSVCHVHRIEMNLVPHLSGIGTGMPFAVVATRWGGWCRAPDSEAVLLTGTCARTRALICALRALHMQSHTHTQIHIYTQYSFMQFFSPL